MRSELRCDQARVELSARLDGEVDEATARALDEHLASCRACRAHAKLLESVRRAVRAQPAEPVPNLTRPILGRVRAEVSKTSARAEWGSRARIAGIAAAAAALVIGVSLPWVRPTRDAAAASEIAHAVRARARSLRAYQASFRITERGWNRLVPVRHFSAEVSYEAPEDLRVSIRDETLYPGPYAWPQNNVDLIANAHRSWIRAPLSCPPAALPGCAAQTRTEVRTVVHREPFDGTTVLPTDIIVPLETLASSGGFRVLGEKRVLGRDAYHVVLPYREAAPLVTALEAGGSWRSYRPFDRVELWIDKRSWFPLRFEIRPGASGGSRPLLAVTATSFSQPGHLNADMFRSPRGGVIRSSGFEPRPFARVAGPYTPSFVAHLSRYRAGVTRRRQPIVAYADGMTWLKEVVDKAPAAPALYQAGAEEVALGRGRFGYYQPATIGPAVTPLERRVDIYGRGVHVQLQSNLSRATLLRVARSVAVAGRRIRRVTHLGRGVTLRRLSPPEIANLSWAELPAYLPGGYRLTGASLSRLGHKTATLTAYFRSAEADFDGFGVRVTESPSIRFVPPSAERLQAVSIDHTVGRWSQERGELEWIDGGIYRAVAAPSFDLRTVVRIAASLK